MRLMDRQETLYLSSKRLSVSKHIEVLKDIIHTLNVISASDMAMELRRRYATPEQWKEEEPRWKQQLQADWQTSKHAICENKQHYDHLILNEPFNDSERETYKAACSVIEREMQNKLEDMILNGGEDEQN